MSDTCPICDAAALDATAESFSVADILRRWQTEAGVTFHRSVWDEYTKPTAASDVTLHCCRRCGFAVFRPVLVGTADFYEGITTGDGSCYTPEKWEFLQAVKELRRHGCRRVLDVGSGSGYFLDLLRARLPAVAAKGFEFNAEMARFIREKGYEVYCGESLEAIRAAAGRFDAVCIFQVLEHVADPRALLETARRMLAPGGLLIVAVPDNAGPVRHFSKALTELPPHHLSRWRASTFELGLPRLGFEVLRVAHEPLPAVLWQEYLPVILEHSALPKPLARALSKNDRLTRLLTGLRLKWLRGVRGLSVYVVARSAPLD
jgi:SAM-dependent methyltransferase